MATRKPKQTQSQRVLSFGRHGGWRPGAGRKKKRGRPARLPHRSRPPLSARYPVHVSMRMRKGLRRNLRTHRCYGVLRACLRAARDRFGCRIIHYSIQGNHIHLIVEATDEKALGRAMSALGRTGQVFAERYHAEYLQNLRQTRNALVYVIHNAKRHALEVLDLGPDCLHPSWVDPYSSAAYFDGWKPACRRWIPPPEADPPVVAASLWYLTTGWKRYGLLDTGETPKPGRL